MVNTLFLTSLKSCLYLFKEEFEGKLSGYEVFFVF